MNRFRTAGEADLDAIVGLMRLYYAEDGYPFVEDEARQALRALIGDDRRGRLWVAEVEGRVVGYLAVTLGFSLEYRGVDAFIDELYVVAASRGGGLGTDALATAERYCREHGVKAIHLEVERHRIAALAIYRRAGFEDHDRYLMTKTL
jgi:GNAT superfamily N-acetyltransferase